MGASPDPRDADDMQGLISVHLSAADCACIAAIANAMVEQQYSPPVDEEEEEYQRRKLAKLEEKEKKLKDQMKHQSEEERL